VLALTVSGALAGLAVRAVGQNPAAASAVARVRCVRRRHGRRGGRLDVGRGADFFSRRE